MINSFKLPKNSYSDLIEFKHPLNREHMLSHILRMSDLYTIVYNFYGEDIQTFEDALNYFTEHIDFNCIINADEIKKEINIHNIFYFTFNK